ncbi:MAG: DinB family protein, partial [Candidatus Acidiferrales bacterium]
MIAATPGQLATFVRTLGPERIEKSLAPGKWTAREIVCHLADCEIVFSYRLRQTLAEEHHVIQPFDQDKFAKVYAAYDAP